jgi:4,5-dihydroxyphthalate decarboxylase
MKVKLAVRDWDYITPLVFGDVKPEGFELEVHRVADLPRDMNGEFDASEFSMSRYSTGRAKGDTGIHGVPYIMMRAFRHRCIVTAKRTGLTAIAQLRGKRIGLAGWQDSGNTWTRSLLRREGIGIEDAQWRISRLTATDPIIDRLGPYGRPGNVETVKADTPLLDMLERGELEAVFMPFMPRGFYAEASPFRQLVQDFRAAEVKYFGEVGYVPAHHILAMKPAVVKANPGLAQALTAVIEKSVRMWNEKRLRYADTTPWLLDEIRHVAQDLPANWDDNNYAANARMFGDFCAELSAQKLVEAPITPALLFPDAVAKAA